MAGELSWVALLVAVWVALGPWTWGYDDVDGAVATDVATGASVLLVTAASIIFPALAALNLVAGLWLVIAPWLVGYGDSNGPVGLSDSVAGAVLCAIAIGSLVAAERSATPGERAIGRVRVRD
jgi:SPW repeat